MPDNTRIEWTNATWNPIRGCSRVSEGCRHCYAEVQAARIIAEDRQRGTPEGQGAYDGLLTRGGQWNGKIKLVESLMEQPIRWQKPRMIFVNSMSDLFHENVADDVVAEIFRVMEAASHHTFQILTKRPVRMRDVLTRLGESFATWPLPNVWLGVSVEDQKTADERIPALLETPAIVHWLSMEPLLGPVSLEHWIEVIDHCGNCGAEHPPQDEDHCPECNATNILISTYGVDEAERHRSGERDADDRPEGNPLSYIDWVVVGGESGDHARPMHPKWVTGLRDQCHAANVPFLFKQWGEWVPRSECYHTFEDGSSCSTLDPKSRHWRCVRLTEHGNNGHDLAHSGEGDSAYMQRVGRQMAGRLLHGKRHDGYPDLR